MFVEVIIVAVVVVVTVDAAEVEITGLVLNDAVTVGEKVDGEEVVEVVEVMDSVDSNTSFEISLAFNNLNAFCMLTSVSGIITLIVTS